MKSKQKKRDETQVSTTTTTTIIITEKKSFKLTAFNRNTKMRNKRQREKKLNKTKE